MFTAQAPALLDSLRSLTGGNEAAQALQAFANCGSDLSHRGSVSLARQQYPNTGGVMRPAANGGGVSGVSHGRAGTSGSALRGGVFVPDVTQRLPPWGLGQGVGSGMSFPNNNYYGGDYYGANSFGYDLQGGEPSSAYLLSLNQGGDYYNNSNYNGGGQTLVEIGGPNIYFPPAGDTYISSPWNTVTNNAYFSFPTSISNVANYSYGGPSLTVLGDTIINNWPTDPGSPYQPPEPGEAGDPGAAGRDGVDGARGEAGRDGRDGTTREVVGIFGLVPDLNLARRRIAFVALNPGGVLSVNPLVQVGFTKLSIPTEATLDPDTCKITLTFEDKQVVTSVAGQPSLVTGYRVASETVIVAP